MKFKRVGFSVKGYGTNIYTGRATMFEEVIPLSLRRLQSLISYKRDQGFCGTVHVRYVMSRENVEEVTFEKFRIYDVPFRGIGRITFTKWEV